MVPAVDHFSALLAPDNYREHTCTAGTLFSIILHK